MAIDGIGSGSPSYKPQVSGTAQTTDVAPAAPAAPPPEKSLVQKLSEGFDEVKQKVMGTGDTSTPLAVAANADLQKAVSGQRLAMGVAEGANATNASNASTLRSEFTSPDINLSFLRPSTATATREIDPTQRVDFMSPAGKTDLIERSSQINPISRKAGNADTSCAGAAMVNGLVLGSKTPADAKANADALRASAKQLGVPVKAEEEAALQHMAKGSMSANDMSHLQQLSQRLVKPDDDARGLATPGELMKAVTLVRANGGFKGSQSVEFHNARLMPPGGENHWTVSVDGQHASSLNRYGYHGAAVSNGAPWDQTRNAENDGWRGGVLLRNDANPPSLEMSYREKDSAGKDVPGKMRSVTLSNLEKYKGYVGFMELTDQLLAAEKKKVSVPIPPND